MKLMLITNQPDVARHAVDAGVDIVFVDLETMEKRERQGHLDTVISGHSVSDVAAIRSAVDQGELMVRTNPLHAGSAEEVDAVIDAGADCLMLPMFTSAAQVEHFRDLVKGRARIRPLIETPEALADHEALARMPGIDSYHFGLNDLHIAFDNAFMFDPLVEGRLDDAIESLRKANVPFGIGGVARRDQGHIPGRMVIAEYARRGASAVILARTFHTTAVTDAGEIDCEELATEIQFLRQVCEVQKSLTAEKLSADYEEFAAAVRQTSSNLTMQQ